MSIQQLDYFFPFFVFVYGLVMTLVLSLPVLLEIGEKRLPAAEWQRFRAHKGKGFVCLVVGALWSLQHLLVF
jgi:hypothetical protein